MSKFLKIACTVAAVFSFPCVADTLTQADDVDFEGAPTKPMIRKEAVKQAEYYAKEFAKTDKPQMNIALDHKAAGSKASKKQDPTNALDQKPSKDQAKPAAQTKPAAETKAAAQTKHAEHAKPAATKDLTAMSAAPKKVSAQTVSYWRKLLATGLSLGGATLSEAELNDLKSKLEVAEESKPLSKPVSEPVSKTVKKAMVRSEAAPVKPHVQAKLLAVENKAKQAKKVKAKEEEEDVPKVEINGVEQPDPLYDSTDERMHSAAGSDGSVQNQETDLDQEATKAKKAEKAAAKPAKKAVAKKAVAKKDDKAQPADADKTDKTAIAVDAPEPAASVDPDESERQAADHELALR